MTRLAANYRSRGLLCAAIGIVASIGLTLSADARTESPRNEPLSRVSFRNDVEPILTRAACNSGACHGSQFGKGSFKLSLAAYDPDFDYQSIARLAGGRRLNVSEPGKSLLLRKPAFQIAHQGGLRLATDSADYRTLLRWVTQGAHGPDPRDPAVASLNVTPSGRVLSPGQKVQIRVTARYSNGERREVTAHARINSLDEAIAACSPEGKVTAVGHGATAVMVRYDGLAMVSHVLVPYGSAGRKMAGSAGRKIAGSLDLRAPILSPIVHHPSPRAESSLDVLVEARWRDLHLTPSSRCTDHEFIRRASFDVIGTLPSADEVRSFVSDSAADKRAKLIDQLLERPEYADYWTVKWSDLLRSSRTSLGAKPAAAFTEWIRSALSRNVPYDRMVSDLLTAQGSSSSVAPANYYRVAATPQDLTETTTQLFLGVRLQCAKCHHHPFEKWSQTDYYRFAAFFARTSQRQMPGNDVLVQAKGAGEVTHPKSGERMEPAPLAMDGSPGCGAADGDRRETLAAWMTSPRNLPFARMLVNRYWAYFLGRGIIHPVDDVRVTNPPTNPELLDALATGFIRSGFDLKQLIRTICSTRAYQLSALPTPANHADRVFYSHFLTKRQPAEVLLDSISSVTGVKEKFEGLPAGMRATQLPDPSVASMFLDTFGRPPRSSACECERSGEPTLPQALQLLNGDAVNRKVSAPDGRAAALAASRKTDTEIVEELYLTTLSRPPSAAEKKIALARLDGSARRQAVEDLLWALLNTQEFAYIR